MSDEYRVRFARWRHDRPFWGGTILSLAGPVIAAVPLDLAARFGMGTTSFVLVGLLCAGIVFLAGVLSIARPQYAAQSGAIGVLFATVSIYGALGGFGLGTFLGMLGGSLCIAWVPADAVWDRPSTDSDSVLTRIRSWCRFVVTSLS
ncbi:DUF6114 domain-containing protein [Natrinema caseinilyticum]|uniref:DUF6114 domain-containing protein n=1 Tax=Natrinema caseinilyticum TaxID=2961570 RepID=UPI0020C44D88|nr:DUF6114 domain-containing protein [Natrinema caseinilyticum]